LQLIVGPLLFATGLVLLHLSIHGAVRGRHLRLPRLNGPANARPAGRVSEGEIFLTDMLSEMLTLREELQSLQNQVSSLRERSSLETSSVAPLTR
jgi:hypothetical protein